MNNETVKSVRIQNFKSVVDLTLELGSFNVLIGENGCGKSNILEAIAFGGAASADKLDFEFLGSRGIRVTNPEFMYSAFDKKGDGSEIGILFNLMNSSIDKLEYILINESNNPKKWINQSKEIITTVVKDLLNPVLREKDQDVRDQKIKEINSVNEWVIEKIKKHLNELKKIVKDEAVLNNYGRLLGFILHNSVGGSNSSALISDYIIFAPEHSILRKYEDTNQIYPLGIKGEGLFQYLKGLASNEKHSELLSEIKNNLTLLDWYEKFDLPESSLSSDFTLHIKDRYLNPALQYFDQRSTNEGFLYLLFYSTLFLSKDTPAFFAIDNIDTSLNPKLCMQLTRNLAELAQKNGKQVIVTTQNPAILDGLNLMDGDQRLFVISRNDEGHTRAERIEYKAERRMKLSEVWTSGFIGGLPENF